MRKTDSNRLVPMLAAQIVAYVVLAVLGAVSGISAIGAIMTVGVVALLVVFAVCTPLRDGVAGRVIAGVCGLVSLLLAVKTLLGPLLFPEVAACPDCDAAATVRYSQEAWLAGVGGLLVLLVIAAFVRQMARAERSHLIRGLSHTVLDGVAMIAGVGWCFLPRLFDGEVTAVGGLPWIGALAVLIVIVVAFAVASVWWLAEADPDEHAVCPWLGVALIPVMLAGAFVPVLTLTLSLL